MAKENIPRNNYVLFTGTEPRLKRQEGSGVLQREHGLLLVGILASSSPDVNPQDFAVWGSWRARLQPHTLVSRPEGHLTKEWDNMSEDSSRLAVPPSVHALKPSSGIMDDT
ncbi:Hypothetical protein FKW44_003813 [Caligus rogercresseyi]|uniref:Uncharacterized protein n=1 Tax=Caligus rogercresseyi TaxID=217165 RepID=A0A7T8KM61_CALRO|nr:Hypothetical protein FKW44_003813 [Caligus rogercresseyi]